MEFTAGVFDRLLTLGHLWMRDSGQITLEMEQALELDALQLQDIHEMILSRPWETVSGSAERLLHCCEIGWEACELLVEGVHDAALEILYQARALYLETVEAMAEERSDCLMYA